MRETHARCMRLDSRDNRETATSDIVFYTSHFKHKSSIISIFLFDVTGYGSYANIRSCEYLKSLFSTSGSTVAKDSEYLQT